MCIYIHRYMYIYINRIQSNLVDFKQAVKPLWMR